MAEISASRRKARATLASAVARGDAERIDVARRDYWAVELEDHVRDIVDKAPPLTVAQRGRLMQLLGTAS